MKSVTRMDSVEVACEVYRSKLVNEMKRLRWMKKKKT